MPKNTSKSSKTSKGFLEKYTSYPCRICKRIHPLRTCKRFLDMNISDRIRAVRENNYCSNCLAHDHSRGTCFSNHGCKHCRKFHHTLLHVHPRLAKDLGSIDSIPHSSRDSNPTPSPTERSTTTSHSHHKEPIPSTTKTTSLTSIIRQNSVILLPTVLVKVGSSTAHARCLLDSGSAYSRVSKKLVDQLDLTGYTLKEETICPLIIKSRFDSTSKIEGTFRVDNRIALRTPSQSLPESYKKHFRDLFLADSKFYESASIDIVIGVDLYPKVIRPGVFSRIGFPTAQSTIFGWVIYGTCTL
ncbi:uncharacterized protein ACRADG_005013 [Cochliomyia hominivorax]